MGDKTSIEWADASWNPLAAFDRATGRRGWFCTRVSNGCKNCYAAGLNIRLGTGHDYQRRNLQKIEFGLVNLDQPIRWKRPRTIFVNSMTDLFHEAVSDELIDRVWAAMAVAPWHQFLVLTKRPERAAEYLSALGRAGAVAAETGSGIDGEGRLPFIRPDDIAVRWPLPHIWLGTSVENQDAADERIPHLLRTPASLRFLSCEPLLGPVDLADLIVDDGQAGLWRINALRCDVDPRADHPFSGATIDWVIAGGESGTRARPMHPDWARSLRDQCVGAGVPFFFKQWGKWAPFVDNGSLPGHCRYVGVDGSIRPGDAEDLDGDACMGVVDRTAAGRRLDGREWNEFPEVHHVAT